MLSYVNLYKYCVNNKKQLSIKKLLYVTRVNTLNLAKMQAILHFSHVKLTLHYLYSLLTYVNLD